MVRRSHSNHTDGPGEYRSKSKFQNPSKHKPATSSGEKYSSSVAACRKFWNKVVRVFSKPVAEDKGHLLGDEDEDEDDQSYVEGYSPEVLHVSQ